MSDAAAATRSVRDLLKPVLVPWLARQRWFSGDEGSISALTVEEGDRILAHLGDVGLAICIVQVSQGDAVTRYHLPLAVGGTHARRPTDPGAIIREDGDGLIFDALADSRTALLFWQILANGGVGRLERGRLSTGGDRVQRDVTDIHPLAREQSNTSLVVESEHLLKVMRKLTFEPSVELEMTRALSAAGFEHVPKPQAWLHYERDGEARGALLALTQPYLHNGTEGWTLALTSLRDLYAEVEDTGVGGAAERVQAVEDQGGSFTPDAARLGDITAQMHLAMTHLDVDEPLRPEPISAADREEWVAEVLSELDDLLRLGGAKVEPLHEQRETLRSRIEAVLNVSNAGLSIRVHGDLHLGQVLRTDAGWTVLDFEGEPLRPVQQRRRRHSPMRDVAGMLRSFDYAAAVALAERVSPKDPEWEQLEPQGWSWARANREAYWAAYLEHTAGSELIPDPTAALILRRAFEIQKAIYEVGYELAHRPQWISIPLQFLLQAEP